MAVTEPGARSGRGAYRVIRVAVVAPGDASQPPALRGFGSIIWRYGGRGGGGAHRRRPLAVDGAASRMEAGRRLGAGRRVRLLGGGRRRRARRSTRAGGRRRPHAVLDALDRDVARVGCPSRSSSRATGMRRSPAELAARYEARVFSRRSPTRCPARRPPSGAREEVVYWLPGARALVPGDALLGDGRGAHPLPSVLVRRSRKHRPARTGPAPLLDLPVERVLTTHGPPVLADGHAALSRALGAAA